MMHDLSFSALKDKEKGTRTKDLLAKLLQRRNDVVVPSGNRLVESVARWSNPVAVAEKNEMCVTQARSRYLCVPILPPWFGIGPVITVPPTHPVSSPNAPWNVFNSGPSFSNPLQRATFR
jgi:hypothetical protein